MLHRVALLCVLVLPFIVSAFYNPQCLPVQVKVDPKPLSTNKERVKPGHHLPLEMTITDVLHEVSHLSMSTRTTSRSSSTSLSLLPSKTIESGTVFVGQWQAPMAEGVHHLEFTAHGPNGEKTALRHIKREVEVTCSDGVFCNGVERLVNGTCQNTPNPCDDGEDCTTDHCSEFNGGKCSYTLNGQDCKPCVEGLCQRDCNGKSCGDDGCNGFCGVCADGLGCVDGQCVTAISDGTCASPLKLLPDGTALLGEHLIQGNTDYGVNVYVPKCNWLSGASELIYQFTIPTSSNYAWVGYEARVSGYDTVLQLYQDNCGKNTSIVACNDDATPPGNYGSRISGRLDPGHTYYFMVDGFNIDEHGPFNLTVKFVKECIPACDGSFCTADGCGGSCGSCDAGTVCYNATGRCLPDPCIPDCTGRQCGDDGCTGSCGSCNNTAGSYCGTNVTDDGTIYYTGICSAPFPTCDNLNPDCGGRCNGTQYCGTDCQCHEYMAPTPDLYMDVEVLGDDVYIDIVNLPSTSCAVVENCVIATGVRALLRFTVVGTNQGQADFNPPDPKDRPDLYQYGQCHGHYHFKNFAQYELLTMDGTSVSKGKKEAYCMEDTIQKIQGPGVQCSPQFDCGAQGIQKGWADVYGSSLDCQWMDVTEVPAGTYQLAVYINPSRIFNELNFDNNNGKITVTIPDLSDLLGNGGATITVNMLLMVFMLVLVVMGVHM